ncbi:MAG: CpaF family protein [Oscillospiraceae bacterium]|nr:CpaF family protein [Oscillospiraceae bacterium]
MDNNVANEINNRPPPADELFALIKGEILGRLDLRRDMEDGEVQDAIDGIVLEKSDEQYISVSGRKRLAERVFNSIRRLDVIQPLVDDAHISEIMVNGRKDIFIERDGKVEKTDLAFETTEKLEDVIQSIVSKINRTVNEASPIVDARLADGSRVNAVLRPIAIDGPVLTIRKFPEKPMSIERLLAFNSIDEQMAGLLEVLVKARYNIFISGGTGSGKTSLLNAVAAMIPEDERVVTIEDSAELQLKTLGNLVRLETRNANSEGKGQIDMGSLIKSSLRMRPDRIIVGEVRDGLAAYYMLQSMNTGHDGSLTTGHANSALDMLSRLETMVLSEEALPLEAIRGQIASAIDVIVHVARLRDGSRKVVEVSEINGMENGKIVMNKLFEFLETGAADPAGPAGSAGSASPTDPADPDKGLDVRGDFKYTGNKIRNTVKLRLAGLRSGFFCGGGHE